MAGRNLLYDISVYIYIYTSIYMYICIYIYMATDQNHVPRVYVPILSDPEGLDRILGSGGSGTIIDACWFPQ